MADDSPTLVRIPPADDAVIYTNSIEVGYSLFDFMFVLGRQTAREGNEVTVRQTSRVMLSPQHAKVFLGLLINKVAEYEEKFGTIPGAPGDLLTIELGPPPSQSDDESQGKAAQP